MSSKKKNRQMTEPGKWEVAQPGQRAIYQAIGGSWAMRDYTDSGRYFSTPNTTFCAYQKVDPQGIQGLIDRYENGDRWMGQDEFLTILNA